MPTLRLSPRKSPLLALYLLSVLIPMVAAARDSKFCAQDPFLDPKNDLCNPLRYIASNTLTSVALACFAATTATLFWSMYLWGAKFMLCMPIGGVAYCIGLAFRYGLHTKPQSTGIYIGEYLFVVLSPCAFIAAVYVLLGRLAGHLNTGEYLLVRPHRVTVVFVSSDIVTFLIQAAGGGTSTSQVTKTRNLGQKLFLVGLILQLVSFFFFTTLLISWTVKVYKHKPALWTKDQREGKPWYLDWRALLFAMYISCAGILVRSFYRVIEISQGYHGHLATEEGFFYTLDSLPLLFAIGVYVAFWPGRFLSSTPLHHAVDAEANLPNKADAVLADDTLELQGRPVPPRRLDTAETLNSGATPVGSRTHE
ncbi:hypothetical protein FRC04_010029 [Tulasnella sp. 424]|nr:hypothetical protein FRC04_010029 [Tulasnella sp. 424]KAG8972818.1 hypothetical protein FRC05_009540 [Tulasnella sp. 425]